MKKLRFVIFLTIVWGAASGLNARGQVLPSPEISVHLDYFYPWEEILYLEGRAAPEALVTVSLEKTGREPVQFVAAADAAGAWIVAEKVYLSSGDWEIRARQQVGRAASAWSEPKALNSIVTGANILGLEVRYVGIAGVSLIFLMVIGALLFYSMRKIQKLGL